MSTMLDFDFPDAQSTPESPLPSENISTNIQDAETTATMTDLTTTTMSSSLSTENITRLIIQQTETITQSTRDITVAIAENSSLSQSFPTDLGNKTFASDLPTDITITDFGINQQSATPTGTTIFESITESRSFPTDLGNNTFASDSPTDITITNFGISQQSTTPTGTTIFESITENISEAILNFTSTENIETSSRATDFNAVSEILSSNSTEETTIASIMENTLFNVSSATTLDVHISTTQNVQDATIPEAISSSIRDAISSTERVNLTSISNILPTTDSVKEMITSTSKNIESHNVNVENGIEESIIYIIISIVLGIIIIALIFLFICYRKTKRASYISDIYYNIELNSSNSHDKKCTISKEALTP